MNKENLNTKENYDKIMSMSKEELDNIFKDYSLNDMEDLLKFTYGGVINND